MYSTRMEAQFLSEIAVQTGILIPIYKENVMLIQNCPAGKKLK